MEKFNSSDVKFEKIVDVGAFGRVYLVTDKSSKKLALKVYPPTWNKDYFDKEVDCCVKLQETGEKKHPGSDHIVRLLASDGSGMPDKDGYLLMEYCEGGNLRQLLHKHRISNPSTLIDAADRNRWLSELISGIAFIHSKQMVHRDLHPRNIMFKDGKIKIGGFRLVRSSIVDGNTRIGVTRYTSPEVAKMMNSVESLTDEKYHTYASDIWSFGCILYEMFTNTRVITEKEELPIMQILFGDFRAPALQSQLDGLFQIMLSIEPANRPKPDVILEELSRLRT